MSAHVHPRPIGGAILDRAMITLLALFGVAEAVITYRFIAGIGAVSNMNDGYAWGIWEPVNVVVFTGIGAGAYSVGLLCYLLNRGHYHPLVRPAVLLAAIAYSLGGASIIIALGRPWNMYWLALPPMWNLSSVLLEVAVCVIAYVCVLWIEMLPAVLDGAAAQLLAHPLGLGQAVGRAPGPGHALRHRAGHAAAHHAPELAGRPHGRRRAEAAPALAHPAPAPAGAGLLPVHGARGGGGAHRAHEERLERASTTTSCWWTCRG